MCWTNLRQVIMTGCAAAVLLGAPSRSDADCALTDWLFGNGRTTYAPPYAPPVTCAPAPGACGCAPVQCAPVQPACQPCTPTSTYRISYRPVPTVAYMPVVGIDPCSGCAVTTYHPTRAWTYQASLVPYAAYRVGYAPVAVGCGSCGGCAPCSGYSTSYGGCTSCATSYGGCSPCATSCGGCSSCGTSYGGCSACNSCVSNGYVTSGGCSSCVTSPAPLSGTPLPGPADMSQPPASASAPVTIGSPTPTPAPTAPGSSSERARTYAPGAVGAPIAPGAGTSPSGTFYRGPATGEGSHTIEPPRIDGIPPVPTSGPQLNPTPSPRPENENRITSRPVLPATYFQLLPSPPPTVPAQTISAPVPQPVDDSGWKHADN